MRFSLTPLFLSVCLLWVNHFASAHSPNEYIIELTAHGFEPSEITVLTGDVVFFKNVDSEPHWPASDVHPTHETYSEFDPRKPIRSGEEWSFRFSKEGEWTMHDHLFPEFLGTITVLSDEHDSVNKTSPHTVEPNLWSKLYDFIRNLINALFARPESLLEKSLEKSQPKVIPQTFDANQAFSTYNLKCIKNDFSCIADSLRQITADFGSAAAIAVLNRLIKQEHIAVSMDVHQLAHEIGRETAEIYGVSAESFLSCPMDAYNGGCQHGFFEYVLGNTDSTKEAAESICESLNNNLYSEKNYFYCYHGVGHGVMMAQAYDLQTSLRVCEDLHSEVAIEGCWQGVFMENVNAGMSGKAREGVFMTEEPLAPCDRIESKYTLQCYVNHAGWLMKVSNHSVYDATRFCLKAQSELGQIACFESIGLMVSNPVWQVSLFKDHKETDELKIAWNLCKQFPDSHIESCVIGAVDNIMNFDQLHTERSSQFCSLTENETNQSVCYRTIGSNLKRQTRDVMLIKDACSKFGAYASSCASGAGL